MKLKQAELKQAREDWRLSYNILYKMWKEAENNYREKGKTYDNYMTFINVMFFNEATERFDSRVIHAFMEAWEEYDEEGHCYRDFDSFFDKICDIFYK